MREKATVKYVMPHRWNYSKIPETMHYNMYSANYFVAFVSKKGEMLKRQMMLLYEVD